MYISKLPEWVGFAVAGWACSVLVFLGLGVVLLWAVLNALSSYRRRA